MNQQQSLSQNDHSPLFAQMLQENSSRAQQWFHAADYMPDPEERRYCLERAVALDPNDTTAWQQLLMLNLQMHSRQQIAPAPLTMRPSVLRLIQSFTATQS
ncbi:MAG: hypothetical protein ABI700_19575 [Chloroflexota bacterium]